MNHQRFTCLGRRRTSGIPKSGIIFRVLLLLILFCSRPAAAEEDPFLIAERLFKANRLVAHTRVCRETVFDHKGRKAEETVSLVRIAPGDNGRAAIVLEHALQEKKDVTADVRARMNRESPVEELILPLPFHRERARHFRIRGRDPDRQMAGRPCHGLKFSFLDETGPVNGVAFFDKDSGLPVQVEMYSAEPPSSEGGILILSFTRKDVYSLDKNGCPFLSLSVKDMAIESDGLFAGFRGQVKEYTRYRDVRHIPLEN